MKIFNVKRVLFAALLFLLFLPKVQSQSEPTWVESDMRAIAYPQSEFYTGFVSGNVQPNESTTSAIQRLKKEAMSEAAASVKVKVRNTTSSLLKSVSTQSNGSFNEQIRKSFESATTTSTEMELPGMKTESYQNPSTRVIYAFAYVRKADLVNYFDKQVTVNIAKLEAKLQTVEQLMDLGQKIQARKAAESGLELLTNIDAAQKMLTVVDPNASAESLQMTEVVNLGKELTGKLVFLTQGVNVFVVCNAINFGQSSTTLATQLKTLMAADCSFVDSEDECDYKITLNGKTRQGTDGGAMKFAFVDVTVTVFDMAKQKEVFTTSVTAKDGMPTWHQAGDGAYKNVAPKVYEAIKPYIK